MKCFLMILALAVGVTIGAIAIVLGEGDDSPGLQGIGALVVVGTIALGVRAARQRSRRGTGKTVVGHEYEKDTRKND